MNNNFIAKHKIVSNIEGESERERETFSTNCQSPRGYNVHVYDHRCVSRDGNVMTDRKLAFASNVLIAAFCFACFYNGLVNLEDAVADI